MFTVPFLSLCDVCYGLLASCLARLAIQAGWTMRTAWLQYARIAKNHPKEGPDHLDIETRCVHVYIYIYIYMCVCVCKHVQTSIALLIYPIYMIISSLSHFSHPFLFSCGIEFGVGLFNLVCSILPPRIMRIASIFGFPSRYVCIYVYIYICVCVCVCIAKTWISRSSLLLPCFPTSS